jgi:hypothetical protein
MAASFLRTDLRHVAPRGTAEYSRGCLKVGAQLGSKVVKYMAVCSKTLAGQAVNSSEDYLAEAFVSELSGAAASFDFVVHVGGNAELHPIDDPSVSWSGPRRGDRAPVARRCARRPLRRLA